MIRPRAACAAVLASLLAAAAPGEACAAPRIADGRYVFEVDEAALRGAPDFSALNRPLTAADRVVVRDGHFYRVGADGVPGTDDDSRVRFFGANLSFGANFPAADEARELAQRLRKAGLNAVRLHHMDFAPGDEDPPRSVLASGPYPSLAPQAVARLRHFIGVLAEEGIYVNLNLFVSYRFRPRVDGVPAFGDGIDELPIGSSAHVYEPGMVAAQERYARELIEALGLAGSASLAMVEISNEASLLSSWQRREWPRNAVPPAYEPVLTARWNDWLRERYGSVAAACRAWDEPCPGTTVAMPDRGQAEGRSHWDVLRSRIEARLGESGAWQPDVAPPTGRRADFLRFLADTDRAYFERMRAVVREAAGPDVPVTGTQLAYGGVLNLDSHAGMDYLDDHIYVDHPHFPQGTGNARDWSIRQVALTGGDMDRLLALGLRRDAARPFVLSEFNHPFPSARGGEALPVLAAVAALQDWDGVFFFDFSNPNQGSAPFNFTLAGDWGKYALAGQSAWLYRSGRVAPLPPGPALPLGAQARVAIALADSEGALQQYAADAHGVQVADAWHHVLRADPTAPAGATIPPEAAADSAPAASGVRFDARRGLFTLDVPGAWGVFGTAREAVGDGAIQARPIDSEHLAVLATALDGEPLTSSGRLLLTIGSSTVGTQPGSAPPRPKQVVPYRGNKSLWTLEPDPDGGPQSSGSRYAKPPAWLELQRIELTWRRAAQRVEVFPLDGSGRRLAALDGVRIDGEAGTIALTLRADGQVPSPWYEIVVDAEDVAAPAGGMPAP